MPVPLTDERTLRLLRYVVAANSVSMPLSKAQFDEFARQPTQRKQNVLASVNFSVELETMAEYVERLGWVAFRNGKVFPTPLGEVVLRSGDADLDEPLTPSRLEVVVDPSDPLNYSTVLRVIADSGLGMLVDPWFGLDQLRDISVGTEINRVLMSPRGEAPLHQLAVGLGALSEGSLEVRTSDALHDRMVIPDAGGVTTIGVSLNGVRKHVTVLSTLSASSSNALRDAFEARWIDASPLKPELPSG